MRSPSRRLSVAVAVVAASSLSFTACSKKDAPATTGSGATGTAPAGKDIDYSTLRGTLNGSGSSFQKGFNEAAIGGLKKKAKDLSINYPGGGSSKGKNELADQVVDFAGTDSVVKDEDKSKFKGGDILYFPTVAAPITVAFNVKGIDKLSLTPEVIGKIFQREIKKWNDPAIAADNAGVALPDADISAVRRSDGSGTTNNFTKFLKAAAGDSWKLGSGDTVEWPADTTAGNGNGGVAQAIESTDGAIGYVDLSDAKAAGLKTASVKNKKGKFVAADLDGATAALGGAEVKDNLTFDPINADGDASYPITSPTWIVIYVKQPDKTKGEALKGMLNYFLTEGQTFANGVDYAPLPAALQTKAVAQLDKIVIG